MKAEQGIHLVQVCQACDVRWLSYISQFQTQSESTPRFLRFVCTVESGKKKKEKRIVKKRKWYFRIVSL